MTKKKSPKAKKQRNSYPPEFRHEAVLLAAKVGVAEAADKLGIRTSQIYAWRRQEGGVSETQQVVQAIQSENAKLKRLLAEREEDVAILKKGGGVLRESEQVKYGFIQANIPQFSVASLCRNLGVARSGYYDWRKRPETAKGKASRDLDGEIRAEFERKKQREGSPRLTLALR